MKVVAKPVEMVAWFTKEGMPQPVRFRMQDKEEEYITIKVDRVIQTDKEKFAGNPMMVYTCKSFIRGTERLFVLKYEVVTMKWMLFKI
jgi:hypothetical protein